MKESNGKIPSWGKIGIAVKQFGWFPQLISKNKIIFERGRQRIEVKKIPPINKWKVEYYSGKIMDDTSGIESERDAKVDAMEMAVLK